MVERAQYGEGGDSKISPLVGEHFFPTGEPSVAGRSPKYSPRLRQVCSWCNKVEDLGDPGAETTHTLCDSCKGPVFAQAGLQPPPERQEAPEVEGSLYGWDTVDTIAMLRGLGLEPLPGGVA